MVSQTKGISFKDKVTKKRHGVNIKCNLISMITVCDNILSCKYIYT
jgi:hypothetical protein